MAIIYDDGGEGDIVSRKESRWDIRWSRIGHVKALAVLSHSRLEKFRLHLYLPPSSALQHCVIHGGFLAELTRPSYSTCSSCVLESLRDVV